MDALHKEGIHKKTEKDRVFFSRTGRPPFLHAVRHIYAHYPKQQRILDALTVAEQYGFPSWVEVLPKTLTGTFNSLPDRADLGSEINEQLVVELYSK